MNSSKSRVWWRTVPCGVAQAGLAECALCGRNWGREGQSYRGHLGQLVTNYANCS